MIQRIVNPTKALRTLRKTSALLANSLQHVSQSQASELRDGPDGWSVLFIVCHLRDYETAWRERVELMLVEDDPSFRTFDHHELAKTHAYAAQELQAVVAELGTMRAALIARLEQLDDAQWLRVGRHPEQGPGSVLDVAINAGLHDLDHLEQLSRCLMLDA